jgi:hypothetical protein
MKFGGVRSQPHHGIGCKRSSDTRSRREVVAQMLDYAAIVFEGKPQDNTLYKDLNVIGWVKWQPGQNYEVKINCQDEEIRSGFIR